MENTAWPDNKMGGKRSTKVQTNGANPVLFFKDVWERFLHIWARGKSGTEARDPAHQSQNMSLM